LGWAEPVAAWALAISECGTKFAPSIRAVVAPVLLRNSRRLMF
jgi:hypothetical protein